MPSANMLNNIQSVVQSLNTPFVLGNYTTYFAYSYIDSYFPQNHSKIILKYGNGEIEIKMKSNRAFEHGSNTSEFFWKLF